MKLEILGLSLQTKTLEPLLLVQSLQTKEKYRFVLSLDIATTLANYFHSKEKNILCNNKEVAHHIQQCHKNIEYSSLVFSPDGELKLHMHIKSWFRKRHIEYSFLIGICIALYYDIDIHASHKLLQQIERAKHTEIQRIVDANLSSLEASILYDAISTEKTLLGMNPETTLIM